MRALRWLLQTTVVLALVLLVPLALGSLFLCVLFGLGGAACGHLARLAAQPGAYAQPVRPAEPIIPEAVIEVMRRRRLKPPEEPEK